MSKEIISSKRLAIRILDLLERTAQAKSDRESTLLIALIQSYQEGHVCLKLGVDDALLMSKSEWVGAAGSAKPLILDEGGRLYLARMWWHETQLAKRIFASSRNVEFIDIDRLKRIWDEFWSDSTMQTSAEQKKAIAVALHKKLSIISGGPGTGKTTTVAKLLVLLAAVSTRPLLMAMAAPTGKAAARLTESMRKALRELSTTQTPEILAQLPDVAQTLHRLIGIYPGQDLPRYNQDHLLTLDVLIVDEASMVDLVMMDQVLNALPEHTKLILLGDKDQLSSVEAGSVLADLAEESPLSEAVQQRLEYLNIDTSASLDAQGYIFDTVMFLRHSHRFGADSGIGKLATYINSQADESKKIRELLQSPMFKDIQWDDHMNTAALFALREDFLNFANQHTEWTQETYDVLFEKFNKFMLLCSTKEQVHEMNAAIEKKWSSILGRTALELSYVGRPIMVQENDYGLNLFNGDIGVLIKNYDQLCAVFPDSDGSYRVFLVSRLPKVETVFAMTVHKSQGSEFSEVWVYLEGESQVLVNKSLFYTAVTRARKTCRVIGSWWAIESALRSIQVRDSGLKAKLKQLQAHSV